MEVKIKMPSIREIKRRKQSIQSTSQITKAMKLVSASKLQKAREMVETYEPYSRYLYEMAASILSRQEGTISAKKALIVISSGKGLAGGFHVNLLKTILNFPFSKEDLLIYTMGEKVRDGLLRKGHKIEKDYSTSTETIVSETIAEMGKELLCLYNQHKIGAIYVAYTVFKNVVTQEPVILKLLPTDPVETGVLGVAPMNYEPNEEDVAEQVLPLYLYGLIYGAYLQTAASEHGARMQAMDGASKSASDMLEELSLQYNRARQGTITRELTEIIAGVEALN